MLYHIEKRRYVKPYVFQIIPQYRQHISVIPDKAGQRQIFRHIAAHDPFRLQFLIHLVHDVKITLDQHGRIQRSHGGSRDNIPVVLAQFLQR